MVYTDGKVPGSDEGFKLGLFNGKVLFTILVNGDGITLGFDVGTNLGSVYGSFDGSNHGNIEGLFLGNSLESTGGKVLGFMLGNVDGITLGIDVGKNKLQECIRIVR